MFDTRISANQLMDGQVSLDQIRVRIGLYEALIESDAPEWAKETWRAKRKKLVEEFILKKFEA
jgi:hypothetical protein